MPQSQHKALIGVMLCIYVLSVILQSLLFLNWDVASLLHSAQVLLQGGNYASEIFTPNPPIVLYLYIPPILISNITNISIIPVFLCYVYLICTASLILCYNLLKKQSDHSQLQTSLFIASIAFGFLILPIYTLGNREHLLSVLSMPYLLLTAARLNRETITNTFAVIIGILAGIAFAIKPHFLIAPALVELYYLYRQRTLLAWLKPETVTIAIIVVALNILLIAFHGEYLTIIIPLLLRTYYATLSPPFTALLFHPLTMFCLMSIALYLSTTNIRNNNSIFSVLFVALIAFLAILFLQRTTFYYHFLPALTISLAITTTLLFDLLTTPTSSNTRLVLLAALYVAINSYFYAYTWHYILFYPYVFYGFFGIIYATLFLLVSRKAAMASPAIKTIFLVTAAIFSTHLVLDTSFYSHLFVTAISTMLILFFITTPRDYNSRTYNLLVAIIFISMAYVPFMHEYVLYRSLRNYKTGPLTTISTFIKQNKANASLYTFSPHIYFAYPTVYYAAATSAQRFDQLWFIAGFLKNSIGQQDKELFINMIAEDLRNNKPDFILLEPLKWQNQPVNYVQLFSTIPAFKTEWQHYKYLTTINIAPTSNTGINIPIYARI